jgi:cell division protein FtsI (penicillin-binding protein 3)
MKNQKRDKQARRIKTRILFLTIFLLLWLCGLGFRLVQLQVIEHPRLKTQLLLQNQDKDWIIPKRGTIFDRTGNILARSVPRQSVYYTPFEGLEMKVHLSKIHKLRPILNLSYQDVGRIKTQILKKKSFIWVKRKVDPMPAQAVEDLDISGIHLMEENKRFYPQGTLAAHVLGRVNIDDHGQSGVEREYNAILEGEKGQRLHFFDAKRRKYKFKTLKNPVAGKNLILTIDETIQYIAEKELKEAVIRTGAKWGTVILSIPQTGEILAMANFPSFDPNLPPSSLQLTDRNKAIHQTFDPGSTFKIITAAAALESQQVQLSDSYDCSAQTLYLAGKTFRDHDSFDILSFPEVIIHSSNVGTIQIGQQTGEKYLYEMIRDFGFGQKTGIDLHAEEKGLFRPLNKWTQISIASISIGYEISITPIQILQAMNTIANDGISILPKMANMSTASPANENQNSSYQRRVISQETAHRIQSILKQAVQRGTGIAAMIEGFSVMGKTGTAQKFDRATQTYSSSSHTASFAGYVATDTPVFSVVVVIDDPQGQFYGGQVAAPVFKNISVQTLRHMRISGEGMMPPVIIAAKDWKASRQ